jgi:hypothetical protein
MLKRLFAAAAIVAATLTVTAAPGGTPTKKTPREALKAFNELVGPWRGVGEPATGTVADKQKGFWKEGISWGWKIKGDDAWLVLEVTNGKHFKGGELRYLADKDQFQLSMFPKDGGANWVFLGQIDDKGRNLIVDRSDEARGEDQRITINLVGEIRFVYRFDRKKSNVKFYTRDYLVAATKEGESLGAADKKPECVVTGGLGTSQVSYKGETFYVCCTGCRDAFNENPEKYIKEFKEKKAKEKMKP